MLELTILFCLKSQITLLSVLQRLGLNPIFKIFYKINIFIITNLLKLTSVLFLSASFFLTSCSKDNMKGTRVVVKTRTFPQADAGPDQLEEGKIKRRTHEVSDNWKSTVFKMEEGRLRKYQKTLVLKPKT